MKKLNYSNFELLEDIIGDLSFDYFQDKLEISNKICDLLVDLNINYRRWK